jgi:hypothetical protein
VNLSRAICKLLHVLRIGAATVGRWIVLLALIGLWINAPVSYALPITLAGQVFIVLSLYSLSKFNARFGWPKSGGDGWASWRNIEKIVLVPAFLAIMVLIFESMEFHSFWDYLITGFVPMVAALGLLGYLAFLVRKRFGFLDYSEELEEVLLDWLPVQWKINDDEQNLMDDLAEELVLSKSCPNARFSIFLRPFSREPSISVTFGENKEEVIDIGPVENKVFGGPGRTGHLHPNSSLPAFLQELTTSFAPLVALNAKPRRSYLDGPGRVRFKDSEWKEGVLKLIAEAFCIFILPSNNKGTLWELEQIASCPDFLRKTIFFMPSSDNCKYYRSWMRTCDDIEKVTGLSLPTSTSMKPGAFFTFDKRSQVKVLLRLDRITPEYVTEFIRYVLEINGLGGCELPTVTCSKRISTAEYLEEAGMRRFDLFRHFDAHLDEMISASKTDNPTPK